MKTPQQLREDFWNEDLQKGGIIRSQYDEIKRVLSAGDMGWVKNQVRNIKQYAIEHTDFYRDFHCEDSFPVVNKSEILRCYDDHKANITDDLPLHISSTSGSTGTPFSVIQNHRKRMRTIADLKVFGERCDYPSHERMVFFRALSEKLKRTPEQEEKENIFYVDSSDLSPAHLKEMETILLEKKPRIVFSYASTLVTLAKFIAEEHGGTKVNFSMQSVLTGGEGINEEDRLLLQRVFGCKVYRRYSDMELGVLGQDMGDGGLYELNYGSYYYECLKMDCDEPAENGEVGRIVITDLFNRALPMIRYDTGDLAAAERDPDSGFLKFSEICGKKRDCVYTTDGRLLSPARIAVSLWGLSDVRQWQFIQTGETDYTLRLNLSKAVDDTAIVNKLKSVVGENGNITVELVDEVPVLASNKRSCVRCLYKK